MRRAHIALGIVAAGLLGCGPAQSAGPHLPVDLLIDRVFPFSQLAGFQVALLTNGSSYDCPSVQTNCLKGNPKVPLSALVSVTDSDGKSHPALFFPVTPGAGGAPQLPQGVSVGGIPVGKNYAVVIEAVSNSQPPSFLGSSCNYVQQIQAGTNQTLVANPINATPQSCNPRFEP